MKNQRKDFDRNHLPFTESRGNIPSTVEVEHLENEKNALPSVQEMPVTRIIGDCTVTLRFAEKPDYSIRSEVAELLLAAVQQGGITE